MIIEVIKTVLSEKPKVLPAILQNHVLTIFAYPEAYLVSRYVQSPKQDLHQKQYPPPPLEAMMGGIMKACYFI